MIITKLELIAFFFFFFFFFFLHTFISVLGLNIDSTATSQGYYCDENQKNCNTFAILRANPLYSSLSNLSSYLGITPSDLAQANDVVSPNTGLFSSGQNILIPIYCICNNHGFYEAELRKTTVKGESFDDIAQTLEGLTTYGGIRAKNPRISPLNLEDRITLLVPLICACPYSVELEQFLLTYPVKQGDTLSELAIEFSVTIDSIVSANNRFSTASLTPKNGLLLPLSTLLIPVGNKPVFGFLGKTQNPNTPQAETRKNNPKMGIYVAIAIIGLLSTIVTAFYFLKYNKKRKRQDSIKRVSFQNLENYSFEDLQNATEDFRLSRLIEGCVYHGRLNGKDLAIKRVSFDIISRIDFYIFREKIHRHPNIIDLLGTCVMEGPDSFIVLEYAKNGSLKDWIHRGLAIKSQFIFSCNCILITWRQRLKICLHVAIAMQYMHHISYVHRNIRSRNVFLDDEFNAKVGNFGMANCAEDQEIVAAWDKGYLAPEYINEGVISPKIDVFAYGVVLLEVLSAKQQPLKVSDEIKRVLQSEDAEERLRGWMDSALGESYSFDQALMLANLAKACVENDASLRPNANAGEIVEKLLKIGISA